MSDELGPEQRPVRLILDASAIVAFTRGSIHVGEVLAEIDDEGAVVALPFACLVEAVHAVVDTDRLDLLVAHRATAVKSDDPGLWRALATMYDIVGRADAAAAALAAIDHDVEVLTGQPGLYAGLDDGGLVIPIEDRPPPVPRV
jgi:hypothetical protein